MKMPVHIKKEFTLSFPGGHFCEYHISSENNEIVMTLTLRDSYTKYGDKNVVCVSRKKKT